MPKPTPPTLDKILHSVIDDPKNLKGEAIRLSLENRLLLQKLAKDDKGFRKVLTLTQSLSFPFFVSSALWVNEPRNPAGLNDLPFILRRFQWDYLGQLQDCLENERSLLTDKTREMGVTWSLMTLGVWGWLFQRRFSMLVGSITEDKIDSKNNPNTLFWKFDYLLQSLLWSSPWLYPEGYGKSKEHRSHMKAFNPLMESSFLGEPMGPNFGRSGRVKCILLDEFAEAINPASTWAACSRTSNTRFVVYTPKGMNFAGRLANPSIGKPRTIDRITLHWLIDETKNAYIAVREAPDGLKAQIGAGHGIPTPAARASLLGAIDASLGEKLRIIYPWYENAKRSVNFDPLLIAQELDVNYNESAEGQMYPQIERAKFSNIGFNPYLKLYCAMDYGMSDCTALIWFQIDPRDEKYPFKIIDAYQNRGKTIKWFVPFITGRNLSVGDPEGGYSEAELEIIERHYPYMYKYADFFGDPAGKQHYAVSVQSVIEILAEFSIHVTVNEKGKHYAPRKQAVAEALPFCEFNEIRCADLIQAIRDSLQDLHAKPKHGPESHFRSALEYGFVNLPGGYVTPGVDDFDSFGLISAGDSTDAQIVMRARKMREIMQSGGKRPGSDAGDTIDKFRRGPRPNKVVSLEEFQAMGLTRDKGNPFAQIDEMRRKREEMEKRYEAWQKWANNTNHSGRRRGR